MWGDSQGLGGSLINSGCPFCGLWVLPFLVAFNPLCSLLSWGYTPGSPSSMGSRKAFHLRLDRA